MGTRSTIALEFADNTVQQVYCHWDGYLEHNGAILLEHYSDPFKLRDLIDMGDLSSLGTQIGQAHPFSPHGSKEDEALYEHAKDAGYCTFYGRDRGEPGITAKKFADYADYVENFQHEEYAYILRTDGNWYVKPHSAAFELLTADMVTEKEAA